MNRKSSLVRLLGTLALLAMPMASFGSTVQIASFGTSSYQIDPDNSTYVMTSSPSGITGTAEIAIGNLTFGTFTSFVSPANSNWSSYLGYNLLMSISGTLAEPLSFSVFLYSNVDPIAETADVAAFSGTTSGVGSSPTSVLLTFNPGNQNNTVNSISELTNVSAFSLAWDNDGPTTGASSIGITLAGIEAVPEPSTGSMLLLGALGLAALRRLRKV